jgi:hypothetical protein
MLVAGDISDEMLTGWDLPPSPSGERIGNVNFSSLMCSLVDCCDVCNRDSDTAACCVAVAFIKLPCGLVDCCGTERCCIGCGWLRNSQNILFSLIEF